MIGLELGRVMLECLELPAGSRVLDAGCGDGEFVRALAFLGHDALGVDLLAPDGPAFTSCDMRELPFADGAFDAVFCQCSLSVNADVEGCLDEISRVTRPGGSLRVLDVFDMPASKMTFNGFTRLLDGLSFSVALQRDFTGTLRGWWAQRLWEGGDEYRRWYEKGARGNIEYRLLAAEKKI